MNSGNKQFLLLFKNGNWIIGVQANVYTSVGSNWAALVPEVKPQGKPGGEVGM